ncbi:uncharacterized protein LOC142150731 [Mixophyes fleayi]|uniref:uncharacterized protein LOC142150731 n=1 Tax=Mixophyes fleayi TaxID=3061075 RepID=UPI003F4D7C2A
MSREHRENLSEQVHLDEEDISSGEEWQHETEERERAQERRRQRFLKKVASRPSQQSTVAEEDDGDDPEEGGSNITRAPRFSEQQNNILVDTIVTNYDVLYGKRAHVTSHQQRNQIWRQISDKVTSCGQVPKSIEHCRKRFRDCKRIVKKKMAASKRHAKGTGGGKPANITMKPWEVRLSEVLDPVLVEGVEGAVDTEEPSTYLSEEPTSKRPSKKSSKGRPDTAASQVVQTHKDNLLSKKKGSRATTEIPRKRTSVSSVSTVTNITEKRRRETAFEEQPCSSRTELASLQNISESVAENLREKQQEARAADSDVTPIEDTETCDFARNESENSHQSGSLSFSPEIPVVQPTTTTTAFEALQQTFQRLEDTSQSRIQCGESAPSTSSFPRLTTLAREMENSQEVFRRTMEDNMRGIKDAIVGLTEEMSKQRQLQINTNRDIATILSGILASQERTEVSIGRISNTLDQISQNQQQTAAANILIATNLQSLNEEMRSRRLLENLSVNFPEFNVSGTIPQTGQPQSAISSLRTPEIPLDLTVQSARPSPEELQSARRRLLSSSSSEDPVMQSTPNK